MDKMYEFSGLNIHEEEQDLKELLPGIQGGALYTNQSSGIAVRQTRIEGEREIPAHKAAGVGFFQVVSGGGTVFVEDEEGNVLNRVHIEKGDTMLYHEPHFNHRYKADACGLTYTIVGFTAE